MANATILTDVSNVNTASPVESFLTTQNIIIASIVFILVLVCIIVCLVWQFVKLEKDDDDQHTVDVHKKSSDTNSGRKSSDHSSSNYNWIASAHSDSKHKSLVQEAHNFRKPNDIDEDVVSPNQSGLASPTTVHIVVTPKAAEDRNAAQRRAGSGIIDLVSANDDDTSSESTSLQTSALLEHSASHRVVKEDEERKTIKDMNTTAGVSYRLPQYKVTKAQWM